MLEQPPQIDETIGTRAIIGNTLSTSIILELGLYLFDGNFIFQPGEQVWRHLVQLWAEIPVMDVSKSPQLWNV